VGHPRIEVTYTLHAAEKRLDVAVAVLKSPTPLLESFVAFPFNAPKGRWRYEGPLSVIDPAVDLMPGAYADRLTVQNWLALSDGEHSVLWSSHDAPVVSLARLWPGRVSPAHSAVVRRDIEHPRPTAADLVGGGLYSLLTANNFGTNFAVSQSGALLFRYSLTTASGAVGDAEAARQGQELLTPLQTIFTKHPGPRPLPPSGSFLAIEPAGVQTVALKRAEDGAGLIVRLWNPGRQSVDARIRLLHVGLAAARLVNLAEEDAGQALAVSADGAAVTVGPGSVATLRLITEGRR
jgi:hypothetical protein